MNIKEELELLQVKQVLISSQNKKLKLDLKILLTLTTTNMIFPVLGCFLLFFAIPLLWGLLKSFVTKNTLQHEYKRRARATTSKTSIDSWSKTNEN